MRDKVLVEFELKNKKDCQKFLKLVKETKTLIKEPIYFAQKFKFIRR